MTNKWTLKAPGKILKFDTLYEAITYAEQNNLQNCEVEGPVLTREENRIQLETVKQYFAIECGMTLH